MFSPNPDAIVFLAPGLVHQFGNLLLTIQGHALQIDGPATGLGRAQQAILQASGRGGVTLRILRILLGDPTEFAAPVSELLDLFGELVRVPVREAGHRLELECAVAADCQLTVHEFFPVMTEAVRILLHALPSGMGGKLCIHLMPASGSVRAEVMFVAATGSLPFPLALQAHAVSLGLAVHARGQRTTVREHGSGLRLDFFGTPAAAEASNTLHRSFPERT